MNLKGTFINQRYIVSFQEVLKRFSQVESAVKLILNPKNVAVVVAVDSIGRFNFTLILLSFREIDRST